MTWPACCGLDRSRLVWPIRTVPPQARPALIGWGVWRAECFVILLRLPKFDFIFGDTANVGPSLQTSKRHSFALTYSRCAAYPTRAVGRHDMVLGSKPGLRASGLHFLSYMNRTESWKDMTPQAMACISLGLAKTATRVVDCLFTLL